MRHSQSSLLSRGCPQTDTFMFVQFKCTGYTSLGEHQWSIKSKWKHHMPSTLCYLFPCWHSPSYRQMGLCKDCKCSLQSSMPHSAVPSALVSTALVLCCACTSPTLHYQNSHWPTTGTWLCRPNISQASNLNIHVLQTEKSRRQRKQLKRFCIWVNLTKPMTGTKFQHVKKVGIEIVNVCIRIRHQISWIFLKIINTEIE